MRKKRKTIITILSVIISIAAVMSVSAYMADRAQAKNSFTVGKNNIEINEKFTEPPDVTPGQVTVKNVTITNTEGVECYVKAKVRFSNEDLLNYITIDYNSSEWKYNSDDDCYYYCEALKKGEDTKPLFTKVIVDDGVTQEQIDAVGDFDVIVEAESIQKGSFSSYTQAWDASAENRQSK